MYIMSREFLLHLLICPNNKSALRLHSTTVNRSHVGCWHCKRAWAYPWNIQRPITHRYSHTNTQNVCLHF